MDIGLPQRGQGLGQPGIAPIQHVIIGQRTKIYVGRGQRVDILGMHAVMDALAGPIIITGGDAGF